MGFKDFFHNVIAARDQYKDDFKDDEETRFKANEHFDVRPYDQLHYDLVYAHADNIYSNSFVRIYVRKYKKCLLKFFIVDDFEAFKSFDTSNENLKKLLGDTPLEYGNLSDFDLPKQVNYIIFGEKSEEIKKYCFLNAQSQKNNVKQYFIYDKSQNRIINYRMIRPYLAAEYRTGIFFDLSAIDRERY